MHRARVAGHICLDLLPRLRADLPLPGELVEVGPLGLRLGGCVANTGLALSALGAPVELVAAIGDDFLADAATALLSAVPDVDAALQRVAGRSTSYSIVIDVPGEDRRFLHHVGANTTFDPALVQVTDTELLHVGYPQLLPALVDADGAGLLDLLARARSAGVTTSVDFATVDPSDADTRDWGGLVRRWAPLIDVLTPSVDDLVPAFPRTFSAVGDVPGLSIADALAAQLVRHGAAVAVVTAGEAGMCLRTAGPERLRHGGQVIAALPDKWANRQLWSPAAVVEPVQTTGAGDTATAGLLFALLRGLGPEEALRLGASAAAMHISGTAPLPRWDDAAHGSVAPTGRVGATAIDGWTADAYGVFYGPLDGKETA